MSWEKLLSKAFLTEDPHYGVCNKCGSIYNVAVLTNGKITNLSEASHSVNCPHCYTVLNPRQVKCLNLDDPETFSLLIESKKETEKT